MAAVSRAPEFGMLSAKAEGLGLGGIVMPVELGGVPPVIEPIAVESRYQALKTYSRHSPSLSAPPTLAPFASSLKEPLSQPPSSTAPTPVNVRKSSVQNLSGDIISYPMVSRIDIAPTYTPPLSVRPIPTGTKTPAPTTTTTSEVSSSGKKTPKIRPPPIKLTTSSHSSFLSPLKAKFGKEPSPDREKPSKGGEKEKDKEKQKAKKSKAETRVEENKAAFAARFPDTVSKSAPSAPPTQDDDDEDTLNITLPPKPATAPIASSSLPPSVPASLPLERSLSRHERIPIPALGSPFGPFEQTSDSTALSRPGHRRGNSDKSPEVAQNAFARVAMLEGVAPPRPVTVFATSSTAPASTSGRRRSSTSKGSPPLTPSRKGSFLDSEPPSLAQQRRASRARSISSAAGLPKPDDAFFAPSVGGSASTVATPVVGGRRPSAVPTAVNEGVTSVGISVQEGSASREVGRAAFSAEDGLTVSLRSYHRPDELEVGWVCIPQVDDEGRLYTTYEIRLRPRSQPGGSHGKKSSTATITRPRTPSAGSTPFSNYRISDPPRLPPAGSAPPPDPISSNPPGSPRTGAARRAAAAAQVQRDIPPPPRKYSARSEGSSFSSESSTTGPPTPRRVGKLSIASLSSDIPPFDLDVVLSSSATAHGKTPHTFPQSATSATFDPDELPPFLPGNLPGSRRRMGRASSYAAVTEQYRQRQFSIDEEGILNGRAASFSVGPGAVARPPKSPKHHRFGCYIPPVTPNKQEFVELAKEAKRRSQQSAAGEGETEPVPPLPTSASAVRTRKASVAAGMSGVPPPLPSGVAARGRKQSIAPPATLVIPPNPLSTGASGDRISPGGGPANSPLQPSPLRASAAAASTPSEKEHPLDGPTPTMAVFDHAHLAPPSSVATVNTAFATAGKPTSYPFPATFSLSHPPHISSSISIPSTAPPHPPASDFPAPDASPAPSSTSSFGNDLDRDHDPLAHDLTISISDVETGEGDEDDEEEEDLDVLEAKLVRARQATRLASKWSDTEDDETEGEGEGEGETDGGDGRDGKEGVKKRERRGRMGSQAQAGTTSWCNIPDAEESD